MKTYKFRFKFLIATKGTLQGEENSFDFTLPNGSIAKLICLDAGKFSEGIQFAVTSGGYCSEEEALRFAEQVKESVLCFGTKFRMGVDIGKNKTTCSIGKVIKDEILEKHGVMIVDDVHGISVYAEEYPVSCFSSSGASLYCPREKDFFIEEICKIISTPKVFGPKTQLSMELLTASYFEISPRSKFLTLILAAEALLEPDERSERVQLLVNVFKENALASDITKEEKDSIIGSLNWLYRDSISQSLKKMANRYLEQLEFENMPPAKFISKCYEARSKLVHSGSVDESKFNIGVLVANLEVYLTQMLTKIAGL